MGEKDVCKMPNKLSWCKLPQISILIGVAFPKLIPLQLFHVIFIVLLKKQMFEYQTNKNGKQVQ